VIKKSFVGRSVVRLEDRPLVTGDATFVGDLNFPHQLHMRVVRSIYAHGRIDSINIDEALGMPGVSAVWMGRDVEDIPRIPFRATKIEGLDPYIQPILAQDKVRYVGEPVAVVFADDPYIAEDAAERVYAEIEPFDAVIHADTAPTEFHPGLSTEANTIEKKYGDVAAGFRDAAHIVEVDVYIGRHSGVPLETRGAIGRHDKARDILELHGAAKRPHWIRDRIAEMLGRPRSSVQAYEYHVGGGFGVRGELYPEDVLVMLAALRLGRPVKWIEDRHEHLMATNHSRDQRHVLKAAIDAKGHLLAIEDEFFHDQGAYVRTHGARVADQTAGLLLGPYEVPAYKATGHFRLTNKTPAATYRAPSRFESTFARERLMDAIACRLNVDPATVRRRNFIPPEKMPYRRNLTALETEVILDSGDYALILDKARNAMNWDQLQDRMAARRAGGELVGVGMSFFVEKSGLGPLDGVRVSVDQSGLVEVVTGAASLGQGIETVVAQICADALGVDYKNIRVIHGQTDKIEYGFGSYASRTTVMTGEAARMAAGNVRDKALVLAASVLQVAADTLDIVEGVVVRENGEPAMSLAEVARLLEPASAARGELSPGLSAEGWFESEHMVYPYGVHIAQVSIDPDTGGVEVEKYFIANDVGCAINPMLIEGQLTGGLAQGLGGALLEHFKYNDSGEPLSTTFADYLMISAREMPEVEILITEDAPSPLNPLGIKGAGEAGVTGSGAAIAAAVDDALGQPGAITALPITPHMVHRLLRQGGKSGTRAAS